MTNTLEWRIQSGFAGEVTVEIRYFTSGISWSADYVAEVNQPEKLMQLAGNVRVNNNSGEDYENAAVRLVVGTIRLVENIGDLARRGQVLNKELASRLRSDGSLGTVYNVLNSDFGAFNGRMAGGAGGGLLARSRSFEKSSKRRCPNTSSTQSRVATRSLPAGPNASFLQHSRCALGITLQIRD